mmetsp:Transcript_24988/g.54329  ORF Transcript_24988/g.54329 Transcript_24988/m.54329 type:complete len:86 (-) Transcript_24988:1788-2045(-)
MYWNVQQIHMYCGAHAMQEPATPTHTRSRHIVKRVSVSIGEGMGIHCPPHLPNPLLVLAFGGCPFTPDPAAAPPSPGPAAANCFN